MPLPNPGMSFTPFDPLPASDLNDIVENIEALQNWSAYTAATLPGSLLQNSTVTASKLATGAASATVATSQATTSSTYADLATVGPSVTVVIGVNGMALVIPRLEGVASGAPAGQGWRSAVVVSGANTIAANDNRSIGNIYLDATGDSEIHSQGLLYTGLTPGSTTFKLQYRVMGGVTGTFVDRNLAVIPL